MYPKINIVKVQMPSLKDDRDIVRGGGANVAIYNH